MLKRSFTLLAALALVGFTLPAQADAQSIYISGGATFPTGDFGNYAKTGWMAAGGVMFPVGSPGLSAGVDLFYGQNNHESISGESSSKTTPWGAMAALLYNFTPEGSVQPYVFGGLGVLIHRFSTEGFSESETKFGYQFGLGLDFPIGGTTDLYVEGRYMGASNTNYFAALAGFAFGVGN